MTQDAASKVLGLFPFAMSFLDWEDGPGSKVLALQA